MSLLQQARSLFVRAGVKSMIAWPLASSWSWNKVVACPELIPTSLTRARWSAGLLGFGLRLPEWDYALVSHPTGILSPTW